jgi:succinate-semialdehyde dehydrogenase/glutarate-semialdehyde dehydrogenase
MTAIDATDTRDAFDRARDALAAVPRDLLIAGTWRPASQGRYFPVEDPATGERIAEVADATAADALAALDAAAAAADSWARTPAADRAAMLRRAGMLLRESAEELGALVTFEMGKPLVQARAEVETAAEFFEWFAEEAVRPGGSLGPAADARSWLAVTREPVGPCVLVTPWNFPAAMPARKLAPALAAGCTAILKPAALTPLTALSIARVLLDAGVPDGVVNVVTSATAGEVVAPLLADCRTRKLSFTGSTWVGKALMAQAAENVLRLSLELGGNAPFIVCRDADLDAAIDGAVHAKVRNNGQACVAANRFYLHAAIAEEFTGRFVERLLELEIGHGLRKGVQLGPLINAAGLEKARQIIDKALADGAQAITGKQAADGLAGSFLPATVLTNVPSHSDALTEEVFAPVAPLVTVSGDDEALRLANDTPYGLAAFVYTRDLGRARRIAQELQSGMVGINTGLVANVAAPFGGVKWSGLGREGSSLGLSEYQEIKYTRIGQ